MLIGINKKYLQSKFPKVCASAITLLLFISFTSPHFHYHECAQCKIQLHEFQISKCNPDDEHHEPCSLCDVIQNLKLSFLVKNFAIKFNDLQIDVQIIEHEEYHYENNSLYNSRAPPFKI